MSERRLPVTKFTGGMANDDKEGIANSAARILGLEFRKKSTSMTFKPKPRQDADQTIVTDLIVGGQRVANGDDYFVGDTGRFYKRTVAGTWSLIGTLTGGSAKGILYRDDADAIYLTSQNTVSRYWPVSGSPIAATFTDPWCGTVVDQSRTGGAATYAPATSIAETATHKLSFIPACSPQYSAKIKVVAKGTTADWTLTLHDDANTALATKTLTNANVTAAALNEFVFSALQSQYVKPNGRTYHLHVTVSNTTGTPTCQVTTASDFSTADYETWAQRLETPRNGLHPIGQVAQYTLFGNGRYVAVHEPLTNAPTKLEFLSHKLVLPPGYECTGFSQYGELVAVTAEKRSSDLSSRFQDGKIFLWDGTSVAYQQFINVPSGSPYSPFTADGILYYIVNGKLKAWAGAQPVTVHDFPGTDQEFSDATAYTINYPQMATIRDEVALIGFPSQTNSATAEVGVYSYGTINKNQPQSFGIDTRISTGTTLYTGSNNLKLGMVQTFGDTTYISWRDDSQTVGHKYGVDIIDNSSDPMAAVSWESLIFDAGMLPKDKKAAGILITFETLPSGASITPKHKVNRASSWTLGDAVTSASADPTMARLMFGSIYKEIQFGFDGAATTATPRITSITFIYDDKAEAAFI